MSTSTAPEQHVTELHGQPVVILSGTSGTGRVGEPDDIAHAYLYCLTQPFATGSTLTVDGGTALT